MSAAKTPPTRTSRWVQAWAALVVIVCIFGLIVTWVAITSYPGDSKWVPVARELAFDGVAARAEISWPTGAHLDNQPLATFHTGHREVTTQLLARPELRDEETIEVVYSRTDSTQVMVASDVEYYADGLLTGAIGAAILGLVPTLLLAIAWVLRGRPDWWEKLPRWLGDNL
jgi:hypothetical protein